MDQYECGEDGAKNKFGGGVDREIGSDDLGDLVNVSFGPGRITVYGG